tara:strand:+ start:119 stop:2005 length:1887 start_codon:yes stop_codon:yes gene_type:complete
MTPYSRSTIDRSLLLLFAAGLILASWLVVPLPSLSFGLPKLAVLGFVTLVVCISLVFQPGSGLLSALPSHWAGRWLLLFAVTIPLSLLWSVAPQLSFFGASPRYEGVLTYVLYMGITLIGVLAGSTGEGRRILTKAIVIANTGVVLYGLLQVLDLDPLAFLWGSEIFLGRTFSFVGQPNTLGLFLVLTIPFVIFSARLGPKWWRATGLILFLLNIVVLLSTVSRSSILGIGIAFLFSTVWMRGRARILKKKQWLALVACALLLAALGTHYNIKRFSVPTEAGRSVDSRTIIWAGGMQMLAARPMGYGLETMGILSARNFSNDLLRYESLTTRIDRMHSKPLDLLLTLGPLGLLGYYGLLIVLLRELWRRRQQEAMQRYYLTGFLSLLGASITLLFGFDVLITGTFFWLIAGMMLGSLLQEKPPSKWERPAVLIVSLFLIVLLLVTTQWIRARIAMEKAEQWFASGDLVQSVRLYAEAANEFRFDRHILTQAAETNLFALEHAENEETSATLQILLEQQLTQLEKLTGGEDGMALLLRAWGKAIEGERDSVDWLLLQSAMKQPAGVVHYRIALHCYDLLGDREKKEQVYDLLIGVLPPSWMQPESPHGRLLWKEHPWLSEVYNYVEIME